jgi:serine/threonine-protein kinase
MSDPSRDRNEGATVLAPGAIFHGVYEVVQCIKAGGMGAVYEVLQKNTERRRALKVMLPSLVSDPELRARFELEAKVAAGIESDHIVETLDAGVDEATGTPFIVMELLKGDELGKLLKTRKRLPPEEVVTLLHQAALALDRTHAAGIVHRDLKPENLFLTRRDDGSPRLKILDFGVAKIVNDGSVNANSTKSVGSPLYMAPEQIVGDQKLGPNVDRYALAHIAFTLLVGKPYWHRERKSAGGLYPYLMMVARGARAPATERANDLGVALPIGFDSWFAKATAVNPDERFDSSVAMVAGLAEALSVPVPASQSTAAHLSPPSVRQPLPSLEPTREAPTVVAENAAPSVPTAPTAPTTLTAPAALAAATSDAPPADAGPSSELSSPAVTRSEGGTLPSSTNTLGERIRGRSFSAAAVLVLAFGVTLTAGAIFVFRSNGGAATKSATPAPAAQAPAAPPTSPPAEMAPPAAQAAASTVPAAIASVPAAAASIAPTSAPSASLGAGAPATSTVPPWVKKTTKKSTDRKNDPLNEY